jgi:hypothetical protein
LTGSWAFSFFDESMRNHRPLTRTKINGHPDLIRLELKKIVGAKFVELFLVTDAACLTQLGVERKQARFPLRAEAVKEVAPGYASVPANRILNGEIWTKMRDIGFHALSKG